MPEKKADAKTEAPAAQAAAATEKAPRKKKVNELSLTEVEACLAACKEKQGELISKYARQLLARKKALGS